MRRSVFGAKPRGVKVASVGYTRGDHVEIWADVPGGLPRAGVEVVLCSVRDRNKVLGYRWGVSQSSFYIWTSTHFKTITRTDRGKGSVLTLF